MRTSVDIPKYAFKIITKDGSAYLFGVSDRQRRRDVTVQNLPGFTFLRCKILGTGIATGEELKLDLPGRIQFGSRLVLETGIHQYWTTDPVSVMERQ